MTESEIDNGIVTESSTNPILPPDQVIEVEPKAPDTKPVEEAQTEGDKKPEEDSSDKEKRPGRRERQLERERQTNAQLRAELDALKTKVPVSPDKPNTDAGPRLEDFDDALEYAEARAEWKIEQKLKTRDDAQAQAVQQAQFQELVADHQEREEAYAVSVPDYEEKVSTLLQSGQVTPDIQVAVLHSDMSPEIAYYLANEEGGKSDLLQLQSIKDNPQALRQAIKLIEAHIKANPVNTAVKQTKAAAPISPVNAKSATSTKDPVEMSQYEYEKFRGYR